MYLHPHGDSHDLDGSFECKILCSFLCLKSPFLKPRKERPFGSSGSFSCQAGFVECHHGFVAGILVITMQIFWNRIHASIDKQPAVIGGYFHHWGRWVSPNFSQFLPGLWWIYAIVVPCVRTTSQMFLRNHFRLASRTRIISPSHLVQAPHWSQSSHWQSWRGCLVTGGNEGLDEGGRMQKLVANLTVAYPHSMLHTRHSHSMIIFVKDMSRTCPWLHCWFPANLDCIQSSLKGSM